MGIGDGNMKTKNQKLRFGMEKKKRDNGEDTTASFIFTPILALAIGFIFSLAFCLIFSFAVGLIVGFAIGLDLALALCLIFSLAFCLAFSLIHLNACLSELKLEAYGSKRW